MSIDKAGRYDESDLIALNETDVSGGTGLACATVSATVAITVAFCPTSKCSNAGCG